MRTMNIRQSIIRLTGILAITTALAMSSGIAAAGTGEVGVTECDQGGCASVTVNDVMQANADRELGRIRLSQFPTDRFTPHFIP